MSAVNHFPLLLISDLWRTSTMNFGGFVVRRNKHLQNHDIFATTARNLLRCINVCIQWSKCLSVNFLPDAKINCQLNSKDTHENMASLSDHTASHYAESLLVS